MDALSNPYVLVGLAALALAVLYAGGVIFPARRPEPARAPAAPPQPGPAVDPAMVAVESLQLVERLGLARRLTDGAGLKGLSDLNQVVGLASREAGPVVEPPPRKPAARKPTPAKPAAKKKT